MGGKFSTPVLMQQCLLSAQADVGLLVSPNMAERVLDWVPLGDRVFNAKAVGAISVYLAGVRT